jgi:transglutaminase-like putative cysteine protease
MRRSVSCHLGFTVSSAADFVFSVAPAATGAPTCTDVSIDLDGRTLAAREIVDGHGTVLHTVHVPTPGRLTLDCAAVVDGRSTAVEATELDRIRYVRPSRYCESDRLAPTARAEFSGLAGIDLVHGVASWVGSRLTYVAGSSRPTDGAVSTLLERRGVCRDYAHLCIALLRACDVPARLVSVYAPGLRPMDFHAVAEALVDGRWLVVDATCLAPRSSMVRIATGRDASDTAFVTNTGGDVRLDTVSVTAIVDGELPNDDLDDLVSLG